MKLIDSNLIIYAAQPNFRWLVPIIGISDCFFATVSVIEVLGFKSIEQQEEIFFRTFFATTKPLHLTDAIIEQTIQIRRNKSIKLGDAIIAATALVHDLELYTRNTADFKNIEGLKLVNPLENLV